MATNFPASLDTLTNPTSSDSLSSPSHSAQHANVNDAVEALQAKVGADSSAVTSSHDYLIADHASRITTLEGASGGKILQIVRATDATDRFTSSTSFVDADISVTITPTSASSDVMLVWAYVADGAAAVREMQTQITDSSNNAISGAENVYSVPAGGMMQTVIGYDSPATTSATTYKGRYKSTTAAVYLLNATNTGQLFAIEVGA